MRNGRCRMHGGASLAGPASRTWRDGRHSKVLPKRLLADAQASLADPDRLAMAEELAVVDARINDILRRVERGESGALWKQLRRTWSAFETARRSRDTVATGTALETIGGLITGGHADHAAWNDVMSLIRDRQRLVESERKRLVEDRQVIAVEQALGMMGQLVDAVRAHVRDPAALQAITNEFVRLSGRPYPERSDC